MHSAQRSDARRRLARRRPVVTRVALPVLAEVQAERERIRSIYLRMLRLTAAVNFPLYATLAAFAPEVVELLLGAQWTPSIPVLRLLALWGMVRSTGNPVGSLVYATGRADLAFKWCLSVLPLVVLALLLAAPHGAEAVALALLALQFVLYLPGWWFLVRPLCGARLGEYAFQLAPPALATSAAVLSASFLAGMFDAALARMVVGLLLVGPLYLAVSALVNPDFLQEMRSLRPSRKARG